MTFARVTLRVLAVIAVVATPVSAAAPIVGSDRQYDLFLGTDRTIRDRFTGLSWERPTRPYTPPMTFAEALTWCENGGTRIPTLKELLTIVDEEPHDEYDGEATTARWIDQSAFPKTPPEPFWSSSPKGSGAYWTVNFGDGTTGSAADNASIHDRRRVRCVRSLP